MVKLYKEPIGDGVQAQKYLVSLLQIIFSSCIKGERINPWGIFTGAVATALMDTYKNVRRD